MKGSLAKKWLIGLIFDTIGLHLREIPYAMKMHSNDKQMARQVNTMTKSMKQIQTDVDEYIGQFKEGYFSPLALMARLTEEMGELARDINHYHGEKPKKATEDERSIQDEMGDVLFVLVCLANSLDISLEEAHEQVMHKFKTRDQDRWTKIEDKERT